MDISTPAQCDVQPNAEFSAVSAPKKVVGRPFQPGISPNPGGRPKCEVKDLARKASRKAFERIVELIDSRDERVAIMAAKEVLDRAYGKVKQTEDDISGDKKSVTINILRYTEADAGNHTAPQLATEAVSVRTLALS